jgi:hypothetical protein
MPWHQEPKKGAASCDKLRVVASKRYPQVPEWGNPSRVIPGHSLTCQGEGTGGTETSQYPEEEIFP